MLDPTDVTVNFLGGMNSTVDKAVLTELLEAEDMPFAILRIIKLDAMT